jgi:uncharacterized protein HemX
MKNTTNTVAKVGAGLVAAGVAAAAGYYFYGSNKAKQHRLTAKAWADKVRAEIEKELRNQKLSMPTKKAVRKGAVRIEKVLKRVKKLAT